MSVMREGVQVYQSPAIGQVIKVYVPAPITVA